MKINNNITYVFQERFLFFAIISITVILARKNNKIVFYDLLSEIVIKFKPSYMKKVGVRLNLDGGWANQRQSNFMIKSDRLKESRYFANFETHHNNS